MASHRGLSAELLAVYSDLCSTSDSDRMLRDVASNLEISAWNSAIAFRVRRGDLELARSLFDEMPTRNDASWTLMVDGHMKCRRVNDSIEYLRRNPCPSVVSWTAAISGFIRNGLSSEALLVFRRMLDSGVSPNGFTFSSVLKACCCDTNFDMGQGVLGLIIKAGLKKNLSVSNALLTFCFRMGDLDSARNIFDGMTERDVVSWTAMLDVYVGMGDMHEARLVFESMPVKNEVSWSMMIARYSQSGSSMEALRMFVQMLRDGLKPNVSCFLSVLNATANARNLDTGKNVHEHIIKFGLEGGTFIGSALVDMYCKCGDSVEGYSVFELIPDKNTVCWNSMVAGYSSGGKLQEAEELFQRMPDRTTESWNALISGYVENEHHGDAFEKFNDMLANGQLPNGSTLSSILRACASLSSLDKGMCLHGKIVKFGFQNEVFMGTALTDMYAKSGDIDSSRKVFTRMPKKDEISWTAMIQGLADNGQAKECIALFDKMERNRIIPTEAVFVSVLSACSHCGLLDRGFQYFQSMKKVHGIRPLPRHYTCMVDLLARQGRLKEAERFVIKMPIKPEANSWAALLSGCKTYKNDEVGERAAKKLWEMDKENTSSYVLLSSIYASAGRWNDVVKVRALMREAGLKKSGGCSWVQVRDEIHNFSSWDVCHPRSVEIYSILELLKVDMKVRANTS